MKACRAEDCRWAFYDRSRNRSRAWCSMRECGNRAKARSYRARQR
jgi:predicted RNA-binding Zn ribbon-like protein